MAISVVFARWCQCDPHPVHPISICTVLVLAHADLLWVYQPLVRAGMSSAGHFSPQNCPFTSRNLDPHIIHGPLAHPSPNPTSTSTGSAVFAQLTAKSAHTLQWAATFPPQNCPFTTGSAAFAGLRVMTDRPCYFVCRNRLPLPSTAIWPKKCKEKLSHRQNYSNTSTSDNKLVGWGLTALLTQNRSYRACRFVGIFYSKL